LTGARGDLKANVTDYLTGSLIYQARALPGVATDEEGHAAQTKMTKKKKRGNNNE